VRVFQCTGLQTTGSASTNRRPLAWGCSAACSPSLAAVRCCWAVVRRLRVGLDVISASEASPFWLAPASPSRRRSVGARCTRLWRSRARGSRSSLGGPVAAGRGLRDIARLPNVRRRGFTIHATIPIATYGALAGSAHTRRLSGLLGGRQTRRRQRGDWWGRRGR